MITMMLGPLLSCLRCRHGTLIADEWMLVDRKKYTGYQVYRGR